MSDSHNHSWYLLLAALGITVLMCISICAVFTGHRLASQQPNEPPSDGMPPAAVPAATAASEAPVKEDVRWSVVLPPDYQPELSYPVVFEYATSEPQLVNLQPGQAILASFAAQTETPLKASLSEANALNQLAALQKEYHIDEDRIFLVTADLAGLDFAARHASRFSAAVLQFTQNPVQGAWKDLPLDNLHNLEFCLDTSRLPLPNASLRELYDELQVHHRLRIPMYESPVAHPSSPLPEMLSHLSMLLPAYHDEIHWQTDSISNGEAWWLRAEGLGKYDDPAIFSAKYELGIPPTLAQVIIQTSNLNAFAIRRTWRDFAGVCTFSLMVDGQNLDLATKAIDPEWCVLRKKDGLWQPDSAQPPENCKTAVCEGPIARVLQEPFLIVTGTADTENATKWQQSAQAFANQWHQLTGQNVVVMTDGACTPETLKGHHLILFGGPRENHLVNNLLDDHPEFLRDIYLRNPRPEEDFEQDTQKLCCLTLYPASLFVPGKLALIVLADNPADIPAAWQPLFSSLATQGDYLLFLPGEPSPRASGWFTGGWEIAD
ncbi:MAG: hypothetical protein IKS83_08840 [Victivallales bacterium]|nr:hypothetical protein [Victivallales bacterium]